MAIAITVNNDVTNGFSQHWDDGKRILCVGTLAFSGSYVTGGDTLNFIAVPTIKSNSVPVNVIMNGIGIYFYRFVFGTTTKNSKVIIFSLATGLEIPAGAYPAAVGTDTVTFFAIFPKYI